MGLVFIVVFLFGFIEILTVSTVLMTAARFYMDIRRTSRVLLYEDVLVVHLTGYLDEYVTAYIPTNNIVSVGPITRDHLDWFKGRDLLYRFKLRSRPRKPVNGYYHIFSKPDKLIKIRLRHMYRGYNFHPHSLSGAAGDITEIGVMIYGSGQVASKTSGKNFHHKVRYRSSGPAVIKVEMNEILIDIRKEDRRRFYEDVKGVLEKMGSLNVEFVEKLT